MLQPNATSAGPNKQLERQYLHKRIAEEHAQLERLEKSEAEQQADVVVAAELLGRAPVGNLTCRALSSMCVLPSCPLRSQRSKRAGRQCGIGIAIKAGADADTGKIDAIQTRNRMGSDR
jgi:hypothetical protein